MTVPTPKPRWYRLTPDRCVIGLLMVECLLCMSERYKWFWFNEKKGWTVLITVAVVGIAFVLTLLWFVASLLFRWRFQFSIRSLLLLTFAIAFPCSWLATEMEAAKKQKMLVDVIKKEGGSVQYNLGELEPGFHSYGTRSPELPQLQELLGDDFFGEINDVSYRNMSASGIPAASLDLLDQLPQLRILDFYHAKITDSGWARLKGLTRMQTLSLPNDTTDEKLGCLDGMTQLRTLALTSAAITNDGLKHLMKTPRLQLLSLAGTKITDAGLGHLRGMLNLETIFLPALSSPMRV